MINLKNYITSVYNYEYYLLEDHLKDIYFHRLSDRSVYTTSMLLSDLLEANVDNEYIGYVGITSQSVETWLKGGGMYLNFGSYSLDSPDSQQIGIKIAEVCDRFNISYTWNQAANRRFIVNSIPSSVEYSYGDYIYIVDSNGVEIEAKNQYTKT